MGKHRKKRNLGGPPEGNTNAVSHGAYSLLAGLEQGRSLPAPVLVHLASAIRARVRDLGAERPHELGVAKQDLVRRGRVLDMYLSRVEQAYLSGEIAELPERYFTALASWQRIEQALGLERVARDITPEASLKALRERYTSSSPSTSEGQEEPGGSQDGKNVSKAEVG